MPNLPRADTLLDNLVQETIAHDRAMGLEIDRLKIPGIIARQDTFGKGKFDANCGRQADPRGRLMALFPPVEIAPPEDFPISVYLSFVPEAIPVPPREAEYYKHVVWQNLSEYSHQRLIDFNVRDFMFLKVPEALAGKVLSANIQGQRVLAASNGDPLPYYIDFNGFSKQPYKTPLSPETHAKNHRVSFEKAANTPIYSQDDWNQQHLITEYLRNQFLQQTPLLNKALAETIANTRCL